jgi:fructoselysine-6-P-deglycase FrlB-like protein
VAALVRHRGVSQTVAITNDAGAALAAAAEVVVELNAGVEAGGVACKTFQATLALLHVLAGADVDSLLAAVDVQAAVLEGRSEWLPELLGLVRYAHTIYTLAPAERLSSALQGALMLREGPRVAAVPTETGDWLHVDVYLSKHPGYVALLFTGSRFDAAVMDWARQRASRIVCVGAALPGAALHIPLSAGSPAVASLAEVAVAELLAAELWRERLDAGVMP